MSIALEVVACLLVYLDERNSRENFILNRELDTQRRLTTEFLSFIMHEVRNPMNGIIGNCQLLADTPLSSEQVDYVRDMECSCLQMKTVVGDVLDLHKVQAGRMELEYAEFKVEGILNAAISQVKSAAIAKGMDIIAAVASDVPYRCLGDTARITQMLSNYLSNAVKFSPPNTGRIIVVVRSITATRPGFVRLRWSVRDNGIGLHESEVPRLFRSYQQASASVARLHGGTGLGLTIVRELSDLMRGNAPPGQGVGVISVLGMGSSFWFELELPDLDSSAGSLSSGGNMSQATSLNATTNTTTTTTT
ncbi:hypothetical protein EON62_02685, partial [archaeon]